MQTLKITIGVVKNRLFGTKYSKKITYNMFEFENLHILL